MTEKVLTTPKQLAKAYLEHTSLKGVARATGMTYGKVRKLYRQAVTEGIMDPIRVGAKTREELKNPKLKGTEVVRPKEEEGKEVEHVVEGSVKALPTPKMGLPSEGQIDRYFFFGAQNNTKLHEGFWHNLHKMRDYYARISRVCEMHVSRFTYLKQRQGESDKAWLTGRGRSELYSGGQLWYDPRLEPFLSDSRLEVAPGLVWCGEMNIIPTAKGPLTGMDVYTGRKSAILPHTRLALRSVASDEEKDPTKFNMTTGAVTTRNYIQRKAGLLAEFHHVYGATLVEVDHKGNWWTRQISADSDGTIYDLDVRVKNGKVTTGNRLAQITWGDPHVEDIDAVAYALSFYEGGVKDQMQPHQENMGDIWDFRGRAWQEIKDPHVRFRRWLDGSENIRRGLFKVGDFMDTVYRPWCETVASYGNHEHKAVKWLCEEDGRKDPVNAEIWIDLQRLAYQRLRAFDRVGNPLEMALRHTHGDKFVNRFRWLDDGEGDVICPDAAGGIQAGIHGHKGARGKPGSPQGFAKMGRKMNCQHFHAAGWWDGVAVGGTLENLHPDWTRGHPGDWSHTIILTYPNGKRTLVTYWDGQFAAGRGLLTAPSDGDHW